jgi:hypothetical protein
MVLIGRFVDPKRARRMRDWLHRSHIRARIREGIDGPHELLVHPADESRALDLLLTLYWGLEIDHLQPEPAWQRAFTLLGVAIALVAANLGLLAWLVIPVLAVVPIGTVGLIGLVVFAVVAVYPGRTALARDPFSRS